MMKPYLYRMPVGIAGAISRYRDLTTEPVLLKSNNGFSAYGLAGKYDCDYFAPLSEGDTADVIKGIYIRPYPTTQTQGFIRQVGFEKNFTGDALKRGYVTVNVGVDSGTIKKGAPVYVRIAGATDKSPLGAFLIAEEKTGEGESAKVNTVILPNAEFTGHGDADGNVEISYKI
uniref:Bacteriophage protein n=1 Tax=Arsenophonus endosymbiont of Trialeurodes vaporariorum TaxID=235567 RepID=A0A3B0MJM1_9GAMM